MDGKLRHMTSIYLYDDEKMLMLYRIGSRVVNNSYIGTAGGHFENNELNDAKKCILRELEEETSLKATDLKLLCISDDMTETAHYVTVGFIVNNYTGEVKTMEPETILEWRWFDLDDLPTNLYKPSQKCIEKYKQGIIYE